MTMALIGAVATRCLLNTPHDVPLILPDFLKCFLIECRTDSLPFPHSPPPSTQNMFAIWPQTRAPNASASNARARACISPRVRVFVPPPLHPPERLNQVSQSSLCRNRLHRDGKHLSIVPPRVDPTSDLIIPCDHFGETEALPRLKSPDNLEQCDLRGWGVSRGVSRGVSSGGFARRQEEREIGGTRAFDSLLSWRTFFSNIARNSWSAASPSLEPF